MPGGFLKKLEQGSGDGPPVGTGQYTLEAARAEFKRALLAASVRR